MNAREEKLKKGLDKLIEVFGSKKEIRDFITAIYESKKQDTFDLQELQKIKREYEGLMNFFSD